MNELLRVEALSCVKGAQYLVSDVSFSLEEHKTLALVGESGSGKTTTALSLLQLVPEQFTVKGHVLYRGMDLLHLKEREIRKIRGKEIAMIFQDPSASLHPLFTIGEQVSEMCFIHGDMPLDEAHAKTFAMLEKVGLPRASLAFETYPHELSGGMKQRVMIAMALILSPQILIADEPTTALDLTVQKEILDLLQDLQQDTSMSMLLITHDIGVVAEMADTVGVLYASELIEYGTREAVLQDPMHPYTKALLEARPRPELRKKKLPVATGTIPVRYSRDGCPYYERCPLRMEKCKHGVVEKVYSEQDKTHWARCWAL